MSLKITLAVYNRNHILCLKCQSEVVSVKQRRDAQLTTTQIYLRPLVSFREISKEINSHFGMFWLSSYRSDQNHQNWWSCSYCSSWEGTEIILTTNSANREVETIWFPLPTSLRQSGFPLPTFIFCLPNLIQVGETDDETQGHTHKAVKATMSEAPTWFRLRLMKFWFRVSMQIPLNDVESIKPRLHGFPTTQQTLDYPKQEVGLSGGRDGRAC